MASPKDPNPYLAEVFNALAHPARLEILELLRDGEACVCHFQAMLEQRQAYISQHLNVLRQAGLVTSRKEGLRVYYQVSDPRLYEALDQVEVMLQTSGKWHPAFPDEAVRTDRVKRKESCTCPQCSGQAASLEPGYLQVQNG